MSDELQIVATDDSSSTLLSSRFGVHYHSLRGAVGEAQYVFIRFLEAGDSVLEVGLGTGLNALLALQTNLKIDYTAVELYPVDIVTVSHLSYYCADLDAIHSAPWGIRSQITENFSILKVEDDITSYMPNAKYRKIFFDAFDPQTVAEQWSEALFARLYLAMEEGGALLTYSAKGSVKRALRAAGFTVHRLKGALGKRHMLLATRSW